MKLFWWRKYRWTTLEVFSGREAKQLAANNNRKVFFFLSDIFRKLWTEIYAILNKPPNKRVNHKRAVKYLCNEHLSLKTLIMCSGYLEKGESGNFWLFFLFQVRLSYQKISHIHKDSKFSLVHIFKLPNRN